MLLRSMVAYSLQFIYIIALIAVWSDSDSDSDSYIFVDESATWMEANVICMKRFNSTLGTISNAQQNEEAISLCKSETCWIGLSNIFGSYQYLDQTTMEYESFCEASSTLNCISINNGITENCWNHNNCKETQIPFLCNKQSFISSKSKCNYFIDPLDLLPYAIDICDKDSNGMNNLYKCKSNGDGVNLYTVPQTVFNDSKCATATDLDNTLNLYLESSISVSDDMMECASSVCSDYDTASFIQYDYTQSDVICHPNLNNNFSVWPWQIKHLVMKTCYPSNEYSNLYAQLSCSSSSTRIDKLFYNDSNCNVDSFLFGAALYQHNKCSIDGLFGYEILHCSQSLMVNTHLFGYINDGKMPIPINKCQAIYTLLMSYKYICVNSEHKMIIKRIWLNNTECALDNLLDYNYFDITISVHHFVDFNCNNDNVGASIVNVDYYRNFTNLNEVHVYSKNIVINECFKINATSSFRYECVDNTMLSQFIYPNSINCSGNSMEINILNNNDNDNDNDLIGIADCSIISMPPSSEYAFITINKNIMFVVLALCVATCFMSAIFVALVWNYFRHKRHYLQHQMQRNNILQCRERIERASVISYDAEDNECDLPGIELYQARKHTSFTSQDVSEFTEWTDLTQSAAVPKVHLIAVDSACTIPGTGVESQYSQEYYESTTNNAI